MLVDGVPHVHSGWQGHHALVGRRSLRSELWVAVAKAIDRELEQVLGRQLVSVPGDGRMTLGRVDRRTEVAHADRLLGILRVRRPVPPDLRRTEIAMELPRALPHRDVVVVGARIGGWIRDGGRRDRQRVDVFLQRRSLRHLGARGPHPGHSGHPRGPRLRGGLGRAGEVTHEGNADHARAATHQGVSQHGPSAHPPGLRVAARRRRTLRLTVAIGSQSDESGGVLPGGDSHTEKKVTGTEYHWTSIRAHRRRVAGARRDFEPPTLRGSQMPTVRSRDLGAP